MVMVGVGVGIARGGGRVYVSMVCVCMRIRGYRCATEQGDGLHFVVMLLRCVAFGLADGQQRIAEQLRVDAKYERGIDGLARAADLGRELVQGIEVLQDVVERALGDVLPFILYPFVWDQKGGERRGEGGRLTMSKTSVYCACIRAVMLVSS